MKRKLIAILSFSFALGISGCTSTTQINRGGDKKQFVIACGASSSWGVCYEKANELCKNGYNDIMKDQGFNRKELTVECK